MIRTVNPATEQTIATYIAHPPAEVERRIAAAAATFPAWRERSFAERGGVLHAVATVLDDGRDRYARLMTEEMGKPISASEAEVDKCAWVCRHYADHAEAYLTPRSIETDASRSYVRYDPLGPVLAIMPWNFPLWQVFRFAAPGLMAGNVCLLKHASNVTGCALAIEAAFRDAGLPDGGFQTLVLPAARVAEVLDDPRVQAATLTGSEPAGRAVASRAGERIKKTVLELGGSDPFVVLADADVERAAEVAVAARMMNTGQSCIAAKRFIVHRSVNEAFVERLAERVRGLRTGDPMDRANDLGPLARKDLVEELDGQVRRSLERGARIMVGGRRPDRRGYYYEPSVLVNVRENHPVAAEETFGPVAPVLEVEGDEEAVSLANRTPFGLGASIWTRDTDRAERVAVRIDAGNVFINGLVKSDPRLPFGGVKRSGYGRELGAEGIREFVNVKTVWIA